MGAYIWTPRATAVLIAGLVAVSATAACSGGGGAATKATSTPTPTAPDVVTTTSTTLPPVAPLTGLPLNDPARLNRPALAIKVDNAPAARPQSGLDVADVVYEEIVEGGSTRFLALFHSTDADLVGPVRSIRPSDPDIIAPFGGLFAYSGGTPKFIDLLRSTPGVIDAGVDKLAEGDVYIRRRGRTAPDNLYTSTPKLYAKAPAGTKAPEPFADFLPVGQAFAPGGATPATSLTATVGMTTASFDYDKPSNTYRRGGLAEGGGVVAPTTVIVQFTTYVLSPGDFDASGTAVEKAVTVASGDAIIVAGGVAVRAKWSKASSTAHTTYTDASGSPLKLAAGRTWVELVRNGATVSTS